jgi:hypothetical protein
MSAPLARRSAALLVLLAPVFACLEDEESTDAGARDAGAVVPEAGSPDAMARDADDPRDADELDSGALDAGQPDAGGACALELRPSALDFGRVARGQPVVLPVALVNGGGAPCAVDDVSLTGAGYTLLGARPTAVAGGSSVVVDVRFDAAAAGLAAGQLSVRESGRAALTSMLTANSTTSALHLLPSYVSLEHTPLDCTAQRSLTLTADRSTRITEARLDDGSAAAFTLEARGLPLTLEPTGSQALTVRFRPRTEGAHAARLRLTVDGQAEPLVVGLGGSGTLATRASEAFGGRVLPVDVLFVIDDSPSMVEEQAALVTGARELVGRLVRDRVDFRLAVTTTDPGRRGVLLEQAGNRWIDGTTPDPVAAFGALVASVGTAGAGTETGLDAALWALDGVVNGGFVRADARLAVVLVSDEEDASPRAPVHYAERLAALKPRQPELSATLSAVVVLASDRAGCAGAGATVGRRYTEAAALSGGSLASLCAADWTTSLAPITAQLAGQRTYYPLAGKPDPASLEVTVAGAVVAAGWSWNATTRAVRFEAGAAPAPGAAVEIRYQPQCP